LVCCTKKNLAILGSGMVASPLGGWFRQNLERFFSARASDKVQASFLSDKFANCTSEVHKS
jgi:hypothetical protein